MQFNNWGPQILTPAFVKDRPFQARFEQVIRKRTANSHAPQERLVGAIFRDSAGRFRKDVVLRAVPTAEGRIALITDPVKEAVYILDIKSRTFLKDSFPLAGSDLEAETPIAISEDSSGDDGEYLGEREFEGLLCQGRRHQLEDAVVEFWYSDELMQVLLEQRTTPDEESTLRLFEIRQVDPDSELFSIPADYKPANEIPSQDVSLAERDEPYEDALGNESALHFAAASGDLEGVRSQLTQGADVNVKGYRDETALMAASESGHVAIVEELLHAGADVNLRSQTGATALMFASMNGHTEVARALLKAGAQTDTGADRQTALMFAAQSGNLTIVELLLSAGADVNARESHGMTPLMRAAESGSVEIAQALLAAGADAKAKNIDAYTALDIARLFNQTKIVSLLTGHDPTE